MDSSPPRADPDFVGYSLANIADVLIQCLEAAGARSVVEVGSFRGTLTEALLEWAQRSGSKVTAVDPVISPELRAVAEAHPELVLVEQTSHEALNELELPDVVILDGDHNYYTLSRELAIIAEKAGEGDLPLLFFHDVGWPHARRDTYYVPDRIPAEHRQPLVEHAKLRPEEPGVADTGIPFPCVAAREGGERNGVLTAIEDFLEAREGLRLAIIPAFFGVGVVWRTSGPWAAELERILAPLDSNPLLARLEAHRMANVVKSFARAQEIQYQRDENARLRGLLSRMLDSRAIRIAEQISKVRNRNAPVVSREEIRDALDPGIR